MAAQRRFSAAVHDPGACQGRIGVCGHGWRALGVLHGCDSSREARARASLRASECASARAEESHRARLV